MNDKIHMPDGEVLPAWPNRVAELEAEVERLRCERNLEWELRRRAEVRLSELNAGADPTATMWRMLDRAKKAEAGVAELESEVERLTFDRRQLEMLQARVREAEERYGRAESRVVELKAELATADDRIRALEEEASDAR